MKDLNDFTRPLTERELNEISFKISHCTACGKPCELIHDFELSACCGAEIEFKKEST